MPPPPICACSRYRPATRRPGVATGRVTSDSGGNAVPPPVLLLRAGGQRVVELAELVDRLRRQVVEDALPGGGLVVAAGQQQLPGLRLPVAPGPVGEELREIAVLGRRLLLRGRRGREGRRVVA